MEIVTLIPLAGIRSAIGSSITNIVTILLLSPRHPLHINIAIFVINLQLFVPFSFLWNEYHLHSRYLYLSFQFLNLASSQWK
jgi:O-antigen/teichoic acid export membrane protein